MRAKFPGLLWAAQLSGGGGQRQRSPMHPTFANVSPVEWGSGSAQGYGTVPACLSPHLLSPSCPRGSNLEGLTVLRGIPLAQTIISINCEAANEVW